jgi:acetyl-CoA synthetase (ADP-forming)
MASSTRILSEHESKRWLREYGVTTVDEALARDAAEAAERAAALGFPVALKLCAEGIAHKTERNLVRLGLADRDAVRAAGEALLALRRPEERDAALLVQQMLAGRRELIIGLVRDRQFGPCVMLGLGGILAEALGDVVFRAAPLSTRDAAAMMADLRTAHLLGTFRGDPPVDRTLLAEALVGIGRLGLEHPEVLSVDVNPLIVAGARPVAVDAVVELSA